MEWNIKRVLCVCLVFQILSMTAEEFEAHQEQLGSDESDEEDFYEETYEDILTFGKLSSVCTSGFLLNLEKSVSSVILLFNLEIVIST